jgi:fimbrial chaperone protein
MRNVLYFLLSFLVINSAEAFRLSPMIVDFGPAGAKATQTFLVDNTSKEKVAIQIEVVTRAVDPNGKETRGETKDFLIFPEQLSLEPGERRNVRVTYVGEQNLKKELAYRLVASQLQVDFKKPEPKGASVNVNFLLQYVASLYVSDDTVKPKIEVESVKVVKNKAEFVLKNAGNRHLVLSDAKLIFSAKGSDGKVKEWKADATALKNVISENILAGSTRRFVIELPNGFPQVGLRADIKF